MPEKLNHTLLFDKINWKYSSAIGYYSNGKSVLAQVGKIQVRRVITTRAQLQKRSTGVELRMYIQVDRDHWYYFNYNFDRQIMKVYSSLGEWNDMIRNLDEKSRIVEGKSDMGVYRYSLATKNEAESFSRYMMNITDPNVSPADDEEEYDEEETE